MYSFVTNVPIVIGFLVHYIMYIHYIHKNSLKVGKGILDHQQTVKNSILTYPNLVLTLVLPSTNLGSVMYFRVGINVIMNLLNCTSSHLWKSQQLRNCGAHSSYGSFSVLSETYIHDLITLCVSNFHCAFARNVQWKLHFEFFYQALRVCCTNPR